MYKKKFYSGFTLLEVLTAFAFWVIILTAMLFVWRYAESSAAEKLRQQNAFENARLVMDALIVNIEAASEVNLTTRSLDGSLRRLELIQTNQPYNFYFFSRVSYLLTFGQPGHTNEFASDIDLIQITLSDSKNYLSIRVETRCKTNFCRSCKCEGKIILEGVVNIQYKKFTQIFLI